MAVSGGPNIVENGLIYYLDAANRASYPGTGTAWNDLAGSGLSGSLVNGPSFNSANTGNIFFDGSNDFARVEYSPVISTAQFTVDCVLQENTPGTGLTVTFRRIVAWNDNVTTVQFILAQSSNLRGFGIVRATGTRTPNYYITGSGQMPNGIHHVVSTFNGTIYRMYRNGVLEGNAPFVSAGAAIGTPSGSFFIGQRGDNAGYMSGSIYQLKIYNRALSAEEVLQNYNAVRSRFSI